MLGVLITSLFALGFAGLARALLGTRMRVKGPEARLGLYGLLGLGLAGWATFPIGLLPNGLRWGLWPMMALAAVGLALIARPVLSHFSKVPQTFRNVQGKGWIYVGIVSVGFLFSLIPILAPSTAADWDTIAYHLAIPKLWIQAGRIEYIPFIHHSNFPFCADNLYIWGLQWGGQQGAKAFSGCFLAFGMLALYGLAKEFYGAGAAKWATAAFLTAPVVLWESGTAYVDLAQGLFVGLGVVLLFQDFTQHFLVGSLLLGFGVASKYTGLQSVLAVAAVAPIALWKAEGGAQALRKAALASLLAVAVGSPWLIRNELVVGNPVFPFFYKQLGGRNWDERRAEIYSREQKSFGVGLKDGKPDPTAFAHAALGLAYQPGRYVNPGPQEGHGMPTGALGPAGLLAAMLWLISGRARRFELSLLAWTGLSLAMWFVLSQQSRYLAFLLPPLSLLAGAGVQKLGRSSVLMASACVLQAAYTLWMMNADVVSDKVRVALGADDPEAYLENRLGFFRAAQRLNEVAAGGKVALYDEVFGFYLDVPYFWANPGHCTVIPYDAMSDGGAFADGMQRLGFTHAAINLRAAFPSPEDRQRWLEASGLLGRQIPYSEQEKAAIAGNWEIKYKYLLADACAKGRLELAVDPQDSAGVLILKFNP